ncbi:efflux RND transporter permease subunit [Spiribacter halobius]|uniref:Multidrug efflux RND transporter permease subunit n=1 Tax=Sediminicurvatus halobius TaxID=2182432 RepID=A0A2U2N3C2_9GAMM|nr:efflux RND transporter permease subunit [Spiribacter halobius]PWG63538.1 hypothetical protein DEM34_08240 [Spiribacter halobius]UEX79583.1 efflux RND transporter permease subunit [Spiribacter halobius]
MRLAHFFIERPISAAVLSILITLIGGLAYLGLPVTQYPEIAPPTIEVRASYPGASGEVIANTVATPLEQEINGVEGMLYMLSQSTSNGRLVLTVTFRPGTDLDEAQVLVQNRVAIAEPRLPEAVRRLGVQTRQSSPDLMMVVHMLSPDDSRDQLYISYYARTQVVDRLLRIPGVGQATVFGERAYAMRVWLDPERIAARDLTAGEVVAALRANNVQVASGVLNQPPVPRPGAFELNVETLGRLADPAQFEDIVLRAGPEGRKVRVRDVGRVELGAQDYGTNGYLDDTVALPIGIFQRPGSNALETADTNAPNAGTIFFTTEPFPERAVTGRSNEVIIDEAYKRLGALTEANLFVIAPPPVRGIGNAGGWKLYVQDERGRGLPALEAAAADIARQANATEGLTAAFTLFNTATPKLFADIDRVKAEELGVPPERVFEAMQVYLGSAFVNDFNFLGRTYRVTAQADAAFRDEPRDVLDLRMRSSSGASVPLGSVASLEPMTGPYRVARYNLFPAAAVQGAVLPGTSTGEALARVEGVLAEHLPDGFVFLLLAAQYESWLLPLAVILIVPMCLLAGVSGVMLRGIDNNTLVQIGFVVLVGLASKTAILIVEFAKQAEARGLSALDAAVEAARLRLRPILMTSFAFILGVVPLMLATGAGAEMRQALGTAVFSGMLGVTAFGLLFTPVFYVACRWLGTRRRAQ